MSTSWLVQGMELERGQAYLPLAWGSQKTPTRHWQSGASGVSGSSDSGHQVIRDKILRGEYIDVFSLFFWKLKKKYKEDLDEYLKEHFKQCTVDYTCANWYLGFLIYAGVIVRHQPWWVSAIL